MHRCGAVADAIYGDQLYKEDGGRFMPKMSDSRRKRIQAKQRKAKNTLLREGKLTKRARNNPKAAAKG